jgi:hypothetical protein
MVVDLGNVWVFECDGVAALEHARHAATGPGGGCGGASAGLHSAANAARSRRSASSATGARPGCPDTAIMVRGSSGPKRRPAAAAPSGQ